mmetsp:Transcript_18376/g.22506  ORF Transcript_18376/g.22506 Transcript_18376/m.22506 type:complete len:252 (+) Transcript_18376:63-818(+)
MDDLLCAIANEDVSAVKSICKNSKGVHILSRGGISALHIAAGGYLSRGCHLEILECLIESGADVNAQTMVDKWTPLHFIAKIGLGGGTNLAAVNLLIKNGADVNSRDSKGNTPLHLTAEYGLTDFALTLRDNGARVNAQNKDLDTPLHLSAKWGNLECTRALIHFNAHLDISNRYGEKPRDIASCAIVEFMLKPSVAVLIRGCIVCKSCRVTTENVCQGCSQVAICFNCCIFRSLCPICKRPFFKTMQREK